MATKAKKSTIKKTSSSTTNVTRIKASDTKPIKKNVVSTEKKAKAITNDSTRSSAKSILVPFVAFGEYFKGAWYELRQVRWPNRKATWSLTIAVIIFSVFFTVLIVILDAIFKYLFELILK